MTDDDRGRLLEERDFLLTSLADLEREREVGDVQEDDYESLKDSYIARAAVIIRELTDVAGEKKTYRFSWRKFAWIVAVAVLASGIGLVVARSSGERAPGQTMTGNIDDGSVSSLLVQARSLGMQDISKVLDLYSRVLSVESQNLEALTYFGWFTVLSATQETDQKVATDRLQAGLVLLRQATIIDDAYPDAHCFLGISFFRFLDDAQGAQPEIDACLAMSPPAEVVSLVKGLASQINDVLSQTTTTIPV